MTKLNISLAALAFAAFGVSTAHAQLGGIAGGATGQITGSVTGASPAVPDISGAAQGAGEVIVDGPKAEVKGKGATTVVTPDAKAKTSADADVAIDAAKPVGKVTDTAGKLANTGKTTVEKTTTKAAATAEKVTDKAAATAEKAADKAEAAADGVKATADASARGSASAAGLAGSVALASAATADVPVGANLTGADGVALGKVQKVVADKSGKINSVLVKPEGSATLKAISATDLRVNNGALVSNFSEISFKALPNAGR